jgi:TPR repeat protein
MEWLELAAKQGHLEAQVELGNCYDKRADGRLDHQKAFYWYTKAAEGGNQLAQVALADYYRKGFGVAQDYVQAVAWYEKAAKQGNEGAKDTLRILRANKCPHCGKYFTKTKKQGFFGEKTVCSACGKKLD